MVISFVHATRRGASCATLPSLVREWYNQRAKKAPKKVAKLMATNANARIGILTISDRASRGEYEDLGGPAIQNCLAEILSSDWQAVRRVIPDERPLIEETLRELSDHEQCCLIVTTGGTGPAARDVTPEATEAVCEKLLDGFGEQMRAVSLKAVPTAILSRQIAGIRGGSLIVNLPGKPSAIRECLLAVFPAIPYCIDLLEGPCLTTNDAIVKAFRPKK
jgi:molybdopterin adenylyltransferase